MNEHTRHLIALGIAAGITVAASLLKVCDQQVYMIAAGIIGGEYALARSAPAANRVDHPVTINQQERREAP